LCRRWYAPSVAGESAGQYATPAPVQPRGHAPLAQALVPALAEACGGEGRLKQLTWFKSDHQRGGGSTASALLCDDDGERPVIVKLPVGYQEWKWTTRLAELQRLDERPVTPRVLKSGLELGGHDLAWLVIERLPGRTIGNQMDQPTVRDVLAACARLQQLCARVDAASTATTRRVDWEMMMRRSRDALHRAGHGGGVMSPHEAQVWNNELKAVHRVLPTLLARWEARSKVDWCHGDLHGGNAVRDGEGRLVLIDMALVHPGHWIEDALYFERVYWGNPAAMCGVNPLKDLALHRRELGLSCDGDYGRLASVRRVLTASCAPALIEREGNKQYLDAALEIIRRNLPMASH